MPTQSTGGKTPFGVLRRSIGHGKTTIPGYHWASAYSSGKTHCWEDSNIRIKHDGPIHSMAVVRACHQRALECVLSVRTRPTRYRLCHEHAIRVEECWIDCKHQPRSRHTHTAMDAHSPFFRKKIVRSRRRCDFLGIFLDYGARFALANPGVLVHGSRLCFCQYLVFWAVHKCVASPPLAHRLR